MLSLQSDSPDIDSIRLQVAMVSRITLNLRKQALEDTIIIVSGNWTTARRARSGSFRTAGARSRANTGASTTSPWDSITFPIEPISPTERARLSTIYSVDLTPEATVTRGAADSNMAASEETSRPGVEEDVEGM